MSHQRDPTLSEILRRMVMIKQRTGMTNLIKITIRQLRLMRQS